jgi:hypothetical protein
MTQVRKRLTFLDGVSVFLFFKFGRESKRLHKVVSKISDSLIQSDPALLVINKPILNGSYLYLMPSDRSSSRGHLVKNAVQIVFAVALVRGMVRWLSAGMLVQIDPTFADSYLMTRAELLRLLIRRIRPVLRLVARHLALIDEEDQRVDGAVRIDPKSYIDRASIIEWPLSQPLQLIPDFNSRSAIKFYRNNGSTKSFSIIEDLITWNSYYFTRLILEFRMVDKVIPYLTVVAPDLVSELGELTALGINRLPSSNLTFDQRLEVATEVDLSNCWEHVEIWHQRFIVANSQLQIIDRTTDPNLGFVAGQWQFVFRGSRGKDQCLIKTPSKSYVNFSEGIFLVGRVDDNWYHFLLDTLPRLLFFDNVPKDVPLFVRDNLPRSAKQLLARLSSRKVIELKDGFTYRVEKLHFLSARSTVFDSAPLEDLPAIQYSPKTIARLRSLIWGAYSEPKKQRGAKHELAILRNSTYRNVTNIETVREVAAKAGFKVYDPSDSFYKNQIHLFANASKVLAPGGAVLANMIFMQPRTTVIALRSWRTTNLPLWKELAVASNLDYVDVVGRPTYFGTRKMQRQHSDYFISPRKLLRKLS